MPCATTFPLGLDSLFEMKFYPIIALIFASVCNMVVAARPNVLFILTEDQGAQMGALGTPGLLTPHMDALVQSGILFRRAYVAYPVCSASKAAIYTSLHNHQNGLLNNTLNYHKPASQLTQAERNNPLYISNRVRSELPTLVERLHQAGYYQGVTHKLHVGPVEKFPYDEYLDHNDRATVKAFIERASKAGKPWHLFYNIPNSHRPFPNSDKTKIRVSPEEVKLPAYLPDTPIVRQDWAEYLAAIEIADRILGEAIAAVREADQDENTIVVFLGDHGPCFAHGKMTLYELGLHVPLVIRLPNGPRGVIRDELASELDIAPTLLDLLGIEPFSSSHGYSLRPILEVESIAKPRDYVFAEISNKGTLPNDGIQERSVCDGRWKLIYRTHVEKRWRQVQADSKEWKPWGNRTYDETLRVKDRFPEAYRVLSELDPQSLGGEVPSLELYDLKSDADEIRNLALSRDHRKVLEKLFNRLSRWAEETADSSILPMRSLPSTF